MDETGLEAVLPVDKSGRFYVVGSVPLLHPEAQTVAEMLQGWRNQQLCRNLAHDTIEQRIALVQRFLDYTNEFPWTWTPALVEEFFGDLRAISRRKQSTVRGYQNTLRLFCAYVADPDYGWDRVCEQRFGTHPAQADSGRKGWLPAYRDAVMFKLAYSYGLRFNELRHLQTVDFGRNPHAREFGRCGVVHVRYGKAKKGLTAQTAQRADRVRLDPGGDRRLAGARPALHG